MVPSRSDVTTNVTNSRPWVWECTTVGTTNGAITWANPVTQDVTTITQNGVVFTARRPGFSNGSTVNWAFATIYLDYAFINSVGTDTIYVSNNHAESVTGTYAAVNNAGTLCVCVNDSAAPPTALATGGSVTTTGAITVGGTSCYTYGITFVAGSGQSSTLGIIARGIVESCSLQLASSGASSRITISYTDLLNCSYKFAAAGQGIAAIGSGNPAASFLRGGSIVSGGTSPTSLFTSDTINYVRVENLDLTNAAAGINLMAGNGGGTVGEFRNCKPPASWSGVVLNTAPIHPGYSILTNSDNAGTNYVLQRKDAFGTVTQETTIVRTGGASDGVTALAWKMVTTSLATQFPLKATLTPEIVQWNSTTGSAITVTVEIVSSASLNNDEIWLEVNYLGASGAPLGTLITSAKTSVLASAAAVPTSTAPWASSPSTPVYQKMSVTFTPQLKGFIHATVKLCKASKTVYVDPVLTVAGVTSSAQYQVPGGPYLNSIGSAGGVPMSRIITGM